MQESRTDTVDMVATIALPPHLEAVRLLGNGTAASVWLARDSRLKRLVAIKVLHPHLAADRLCCKRFEREAQAAARLNHEGITTVYSTGRLADERPFIVMQYVEGSNLAEVIGARGVFDMSQACKVLSQIASALTEAHARGIVHRDIKPANILIDDATQQAVITDFGIAAILTSGTEAITRLTREDERLGDPRYMSPEQLRGEPLTGQTDIYGLGIIAFELLTGRGPFDDAEIRNLSGAHLRRPVPDLHLRCPALPPALAELLVRCLAKQPALRPRAADLAVALADPDSLHADVVRQDGPIAGFFAELRQRKVYGAAAAYAATAFIVLQVLDLLLPALTDGAAVYRLAVLAVISGFPITIVLAWIYNLERGRLVRTDAADSQPQRRPVRYVALGVVLVVSAGLAAWVVFS